MLNLDKVDFGYINKEGSTIYSACFEHCLNATRQLKRPASEVSKLIDQAEEIFFILIDEGQKRGFNTDEILEIPDSTGQTCFMIASIKSKKITNYIIQRNIKINSIDSRMMIPQFKYEDLSIKMMEKGINPNIIDYTGYSQVQRYPDSFKSKESQELLKKFQKSIHYSINDIKCDKDCPTDCPSSFKKYYYKEGKLVDIENGDRLGQGGFGMVFKVEFHGKQMAAKCVRIGKIESQKFTEDAQSDLQKNIAEYTTQLGSPGSGIIMPTAIVRQQDQKQDENKKWIASNYNIYIYPKYHKNLYELHDKYHDQFTEQILADIIHQCITRKSSIFENPIYHLRVQPLWTVILSLLNKGSNLGRTLKSLETLGQHNQTHNDIKPQNYLVKFLDGNRHEMDEKEWKKKWKNGTNEIGRAHV